MPLLSTHLFIMLLYSRVWERDSWVQSWYRMRATGMTSLWLQNIASVHCHGDAMVFILRVLISVKEIHWLPSKWGEPQSVPWKPISDWRQRRKKSFRRPFPTEGSISLCFSGLKALTLLWIITLSSIRQLSSCTPGLKGFENVKYALISIIARDAARNWA